MAESPPTDNPDKSTESSGDDEFTPSAVAGLFDREPREVSRGDPTPIERLLGTPTRVSVLATLASAPAEQLPMTVAELSERADTVTKASFSKHKDDLLASGVVEIADEVGGTTRYQLNDDHPVAQAWQMLVSLSLVGRTRVHVDERFLGGVDGELDVATAERINAAAADGVDVREDALEDVDSVEDLSPADVLEDADRE